MAEPGDFQRFVAALGEVPRPSLHRQLFDAYAEAAALEARAERAEAASRVQAELCVQLVKEKRIATTRAERLAGLLGEARMFASRVASARCSHDSDECEAWIHDARGLVATLAAELARGGGDNAKGAG